MDAGSSPYLIFGINEVDLVGFSGGLLCSTENPCGDGTSAYLTASGIGDLDLQSGTVVPAATPEPSSFLLLGTGLLGIAGMMRKRFA